NLSSATNWTRFARLWGISVWACAVIFGASDRLASLLQVSAAVVAAGAVFLTFRHPSGGSSRLSVLLSANPLAAPYCALYDAVFLTVAGLMFLVERSRRHEMLPALLALCMWIVPVLSPPLVVWLGRFVPALIAAFMLFAMSRVRTASSESDAVYAV